MNITRRALAASPLAALLPRPVRAQAAWPDRPLRLIVPLTAGGIADLLARQVAEHLQGRLGKPVVVENRAGAGGFIGMDLVARAAPDGHTLGMGNIAANAIGPALQRDRVPYDPVRGFTPICLVAITPSVLVVNPARVPVANLAEFIAHLRANPGKLNYGSSGVGTSLHLGMEMLIQATGVPMTHVPYRGSSEMIPQLLAGTVDLAIDGFATAWPHVQAGRLRAIAVPTPQRLPFAPDLPAVAEQVPGVGLSPWHGIMGPAGLPAPIVQRLNSDIVAHLRDPAVVQRMAGLGAVAAPNTPEAFATMMAQEAATFRALIDRTGITAG
ncbi:Bug family tripartite tricarboxylate transporter substrate binding protein [Falsiroseomonas selenitidurans]|uniref:Tripartite tricarboxylate transporter substrate binding protein n=1 Tax=Falsiroseomonas selenitidurans TaxID=2716335 RepID=A0ABX1E0B3_9PROT|nr:tripartite tricarboxylate transporter substrate binding protein [Falsiroseomonas selenitidurans]NKC30584.1 tripartite tricarboxylate transporter substrate binding protein [Falsiroseomonas selenitidurans]